ncbi:MAG: tol-pal system protein YbgF [Deltaproteobacteria bacterium]|nr:tol-pal system protein YbgF [Candidatus Zymogenaceae bacterium]
MTKHGISIGLKRAVTALLLVFAAIGLASCVTLSGQSDLEREVSYLRRDVDDLMSARYDEKAASGANYDILSEEVRELRGSYELLQHESDSQADELSILSDVVNRTIVDLENRLYAIETRLAAIEAELGITPSSAPVTTPPTTPDTAPAPPSPATTPPADTTPTPSPIGKEGDKIYYAAYERYQDGDYTDAINDFSTFIATYPESSLADNAQFWIGECYYSQGEYEMAILEYDKVINSYPGADKVPSAYLKIGYAFAELGDEGSARAFLMELIDKYPDEPQSDLAKKKLESL